MAIPAAPEGMPAFMEQQRLQIKAQDSTHAPLIDSALATPYAPLIKMDSSPNLAVDTARIPEDRPVEYLAEARALYLNKYPPFAVKSMHTKKVIRNVYLTKDGQRPETPLPAQLVPKQWSKDLIYWTLDRNEKCSIVKAYPNGGSVRGARWIYRPWSGILDEMDKHAVAYSTVGTKDVRPRKAQVSATILDGDFSDASRLSDEDYLSEASQRSRRPWNGLLRRNAGHGVVSAFESVQHFHQLASDPDMSEELAVQSTSPSSDSESDNENTSSNYHQPPRDTRAVSDEFSRQTLGADRGSPFLDSHHASPATAQAVVASAQDLLGSVDDTTSTRLSPEIPLSRARPRRVFKPIRKATSPPASPPVTCTKKASPKKRKAGVPPNAPKKRAIPSFPGLSSSKPTPPESSLSTSTRPTIEPMPSMPIPSPPDSSRPAHPTTEPMDTMPILTAYKQTHTTLRASYNSSIMGVVPLKLRSCMTIDTFFGTILTATGNTLQDRPISTIMVTFDWKDPGDTKKSIFVRRDVVDSMEVFLEVIDDAPCWKEERGRCEIAVDVVME